MGLFDDAIATCKQYLKPVKRVKQRLEVLEQQAKLSREQHAELMHNERKGMDTSTDESQERSKKPKKHNTSIKSSINKTIDRKKSVQELSNQKKVTYNDSTQLNKVLNADDFRQMATALHNSVSPKNQKHTDSVMKIPTIEVLNM